MYQRVVAPLVTIALLILLAYMVYTVARPFLVAIGWGAILTVVTFPLYDRLRRLLRGRSGVAATLMLFAIVLVLVVPTLTLMGTLSRQAAEVYPRLETLASQENPLQPVLEKIDAYKNNPLLGPLASWIRPQLAAASGDIRTTLPEGMKKVIGGITGLLTAALSNLVVFLFNLVLTLAALGIFYTRGESLAVEVTSLLPMPLERSRNLMNRVVLVTKAVVKGVGLTCIAQGALGGIGFWATGLPSPILFGTVMAFGSLVPVVGTTVVWLPGALYLLVSGQTIAGIGLILWGIVVVGNIDNVLRPLLIGGNTGLPMPLLIVGILGGLFSYGLTGLVLGPLVLTVLLFLLEEYRREMDAPGTPTPADPGTGTPPD
jgi:predicted PurR-regulated permease PerM